jgi:LppX_LprAFG lipoprotein
MNISDILKSSGEDLPSQFADKKWLKLDISKYAGASGSSLSGLGQANPTSALDALRGAGDVTTVGTEEIDGVETTHYRAEIDPQQAVWKAPVESQAKLREALSQLGDQKIPVDVWIDNDGQAVKYAVNVDVPGKGEVTESFEFYDYGADVDVTAPPDSEVADMSSMLNGLPTAPVG